MATGFIREGDVFEVEAPSGGLVSGNVYVAGQAFGVVLENTVSGATARLRVGGVWPLTKINAASTSMAVGANVHWDATNAQCTVSATSNAKIGVAQVAAANTDTTVTVRLNPSF